MDKRGQFFLLAAVVIIGILLGMSVIYNTTRAPREDTTVYDLSKEFYYEGAQVVDYSVIKTDPNLGDYLKGIVEDYLSTKADKNTEFIIIYGNLEGLYYTNCAYSGDINLGDTQSPQCNEEFQTVSVVNSSNKVEVLYKNSTYSFDLKDGQNFYILLKTTDTSVEGS